MTPEGKLAEGAAIILDLHDTSLAYDSSRMEMRLLRETRSVFEYLCDVWQLSVRVSISTIK
jgi:hypothetical protein